MIETLVEYENGGKIEVYRIVDQSTSDFKRILACCDYFAREGAHTLITPKLHHKSPLYSVVYKSIAGTIYWGKCPDFNVNGVWYEHEGYDKKKDLSDYQKRADTFSKMITRGVKQSDRIIVEDCNVCRRYARRSIHNRVHWEHQNITEVYIRTGSTLELVYKKQQTDANAGLLSPNP
jgi:hypothetical protein